VLTSQVKWFLALPADEALLFASAAPVMENRRIGLGFPTSIQGEFYG